MARGRIMNRAAIQEASQFLNIEGVTQYPSTLDLSDVKAVTILGGVGMSPLFSLSRHGMGLNGDGSLSISGVSTVTLNLLNPGIVAGNNPLFDNTNFDCQVAALELLLAYDAAGALADNTQDMSLFINRSEGYGSAQVVAAMGLDKWVQVRTGSLGYRWVLGQYNRDALAYLDAIPVAPGMGSTYIPRKDNLSLNLTRRSGGVWPANTTLLVKMTILSQQRLPQTGWLSLP